MSARPRNGTAPAVDLTMMYAVHRALRRDLRLLSAALPGRPAAFREGWQRFRTYLTIHHVSEDTSLWPVLRTRLAGRPEALELLRAMEAEHARLDRIVGKVDTALGGADGTRVPVELMAEATACLDDHLDHEEAQALPLLESELTAAEWHGFVAEQRSRVGIAGAATFFPWLLDGATPDERRDVLARLPSPLRLVNRLVWLPRYRRRSPWRHTGAS